MIMKMNIENIDDNIVVDHTRSPIAIFYMGERQHEHPYRGLVAGSPLHNEW